MNINLSASERTLLRAVLKDYVGETKSEIRHTMTMSYKDMLKKKEAVAKGLLGKLAHSSKAAA